MGEKLSFDLQVHMMKCRKVRGQIVAWLDEELAPSSVCQLEEHVEHCPQCTALVARYRQQTTTLRACRPERKLQPPEFWGEMDDALVQHLQDLEPSDEPAVPDTRSARRFRVPLTAALAYAAALLMALCWGWFAQDQKEQAEALVEVLDRQLAEKRDLPVVGSRVDLDVIGRLPERVVQPVQASQEGAWVNVSATQPVRYTPHRGTF